jgi:hypothetical protein
MATRGTEDTKTLLCFLCLLWPFQFWKRRAAIPPFRLSPEGFREESDPKQSGKTASVLRFLCLLAAIPKSGSAWLADGRDVNNSGLLLGSRPTSNHP